MQYLTYKTSPNTSGWLRGILQIYIYIYIRVFYITNEMHLIKCSLFYQRSTCFGRAYRPSSGGVDGLELSSNPSTPAVDSRKA